MLTSPPLQEQEGLAKKAAINACAQASLEMRLQGQLQQELLWLQQAQAQLGVFGVQTIRHGSIRVYLCV